MRPRVGLLLRLAAALLFTCGAASAQQSEPTWSAQVDALFAEWNRPDSPGCILGVIQEGRLIYARGFGQASLEHARPITPQTVFDIGSTSKQFTAACIGLLAQENELGVEDDVRDWVPELPDLGAKITLDHLLHHTSGLTDYLFLLAADGAKEEDWTTAADALAALAGLKELEFAPGSKYAYSNTNFFLLSIVVERASGKTLVQFAEERIFRPLGMNETLILDDHTLVIPRRATGYRPRKNGGFAVCMSDYEQTGDGAVQTTLEDLARWDANFYSQQVGGAALYSFLHARGRLADGSALEYARGLMSDAFRGLPRVHHGGAWAGYRAELMRFPVQKTSIVCLCNLGSMRPTTLCEQVAEVVLGERMSAK